MSSEARLFRHELKFFIDESEMEILVKRIGTVISRDANACSGAYTIRSLYFDDMFAGAYEDKLAGVERRKKYRIRIYNYSDSVIKLECKQKQGQYIHKTAAALSRGEADALIAGDYGFLIDRGEPVCRQFYLECAGNKMMPKVVVDYDRIPFVFPYGDVRITFDCGIRAGLFCGSLYDCQLPVAEVLEPGKLIMEVKYTQYLPEFIRSLLCVSDGEYTAYSKYTICLEKKKELSGGV